MRKTTSKIFSILLSASMVFSILTINTTTTHAETISDTLNLYSKGAVVPIEEVFVPESENASTKIASFSTDSIEQTIYDGLNNFQEEINVEKFNLSSDDFRTKLENVLNSCPELFYVESNYGIRSVNGIVSDYMPVYTATPAQMASQKTYFNNEMNKIVAKVDKNWSDVEKVVFIHDYLAQNFEYDTSYQIYDAYNFFTKGKGVCQAYTSVFAGLMKKLGIEVTTAASDSMMHIWNLVKINGNWYHVDVTWDDPSSDVFGLAHHDYLLLSDTKMEDPNDNNRHHDWVTSYKCTDTAYDNYFWAEQSVTSPFKYLDGNWYYASYDDENEMSSLYECDLKTPGKIVASLGLWYLYGDDNSYYLDAFCGLDVYGDKLYYNTQDSIYSYTPSGEAVTLETKPEVTGKLYGLRVRNGKLQYGVTTDYYTYTIQSYTLPQIEGTPSDPIDPVDPIDPIDPSEAELGDVNLDGLVNLNDAKYLLKAALGIVTLTDDQRKVADLDSNSQINLNDAKLMLKLALGIITADSLQKTAPETIAANSL